MSVINRHIDFHAPDHGKAISRTQVICVPCPKCGADINECCYGARGKERTSAHLERYRLFRTIRARKKA